MRCSGAPFSVSPALHNFRREFIEDPRPMCLSSPVEQHTVTLVPCHRNLAQAPWCYCGKKGSDSNPGLHYVRCIPAEILV